MTVSPWLEGLRRRLVRLRADHTRKARAHTAARNAEYLEQRTLLTVVTFFDEGKLEVLADAGESVVVQDNPNSPGFVQILADDSPVLNLPFLQSADVTSLNVITGASNDVVDLSGISSSTFPFLAGITVDTGHGDDSITTAADIGTSVLAGDGHDTIIGGTGDDILNGEDGNDTIDAGDGANTVSGGDGNDTLTSGVGNDAVNAGDGDDSVDSGSGGDTIMGGDGNDTLLSGDGDDLTVGESGNDSIITGNGDDTVFAGAGRDLISGEAGNDSLSGNGGRDTVLGGDGDDVLAGDGSGDSLEGGDGNDFLTGNGGRDTLRGGDDNDTLFGGSGDDDANGNLGNDVIHGNTGDDTLCGGLGADSLDGDAGDDLIQSVCELVTPLGIAVGDVNVEEGGAADVVLVVDQSGSTSLTFSGTPVGDVNNDGSSNTVFDAELASLLAFQQDLIARGVSANLSIVTFGSTSVIVDMDPSTGTLDLTTTPTADNDGNGVADFEDVVRSLQITGATNFEPPLQDSIQVFNSLGTAPGDGTLVFLSDGSPFDQGAYDDEVMTLQNLGVTLRAFGVGAGANLGPLQVIDPNATIVNSSDELAMALTGLGVTSGSTSIEIALSEPAPFDFTVDYFTTPGTATPNVDYIPLTGTVTFLAGESTAMIPIQINSDLLIEGIETFFVNLTNPQALTPTFTPFEFVDPTSQVNVFDRGDTVPPNPPLPPPVTLPSLGRGIDPDGDTMHGGSGRDTIIGDLGPDLIVGNGANDLLDGAQGDDTILGGSGHDTLLGMEGNDRLIGNSGNDLLDGGEGEDTLVWGGGGHGVDTLKGGSGSNTAEIAASNADNNLHVDQTAFGTLQVSEGAASIEINDSLHSVVVNGGGGNDAITVGDVRRGGLVGLFINGDGGDDVLDATGAVLGNVQLRMNGNAGNDTLTGSEFRETLSGGTGDDVLNAGGGDDVVNGDDGADVADGGSGNDTLNGGNNNDSLSGGDGDDRIVGGFDNDTLLGNNGNDTLLGQFGDDLLVGGAHADSLEGSSGADTLHGGGGHDFLDGGRNDDFIRGQGGDDTLLGDHGDDLIDGDGGDDEILGGDGDDTIMGGNGHDGISGGDGNDILKGELGKDTIVGGDGDDFIVGGGSSDILMGDQGIDFLNGNSGNDIGVTGEGDDPTPRRIELIDETFTLTPAMLANLDGL